MPVLVELYLKEYPYFEELISINQKLLSKIDLDIALEKLQDNFTPEQWKVIDLYCQGYTYVDIAKELNKGFRFVRTTQRAICSAVEHLLGWDYSDGKVHYMVARRLNIAKLSPEEHKFVRLKMENINNYSFREFNIHNFAFNHFDRVVLR